MNLNEKYNYLVSLSLSGTDWTLEDRLLLTQFDYEAYIYGHDKEYIIVNYPNNYYELDAGLQ